MAALIPVEIAKNRVVSSIGAGAPIAAAMKAVDRQPKTYEMWRRDDKDFAARVDAVRAARVAALADGKEMPTAPVAKNMSFEAFCKEYLDIDLYAHQRAWVDVLEGRTPEMVEGGRFVQGNPRRILINVPPGHAKSTTLTALYPVYRICMNPRVRIIIISQTKNLADKFLGQIKQFLTSPKYAKMHATFAPGGSWKVPGKQWTANRIFVAGSDAVLDDDGVPNKDATVEALGYGSQIYGMRSDLIILDDVATLDNAHQHEKQIRKINQDIASRLHGGKLMVVGTRVGPTDLYSELSNAENYTSGKSPWTHLVQPAVLQFADNPADWTTLWPKSTSPYDEESEADENGLYTMFDGHMLETIRDSMPLSTWSLVYMQQSMSEDSVFNQKCVLASVDGMRKPGPLRAGAMGHPRSGGEGMWTIASMDPAMSGETFTIVGKVDRNTQKRWVENAFVQASPHATYFRELIKSVTVEYGVNEWVIEEQGFQGFLVHDPEIRLFLSSRGVRMTGHYTGKNKADPDFGVASVAPLFGSLRRINEGAGREVHNGDNLIHLPDQSQSQGVKTLIEELLTWVPGTRGSKLRQDGPMALWFFELRARQILGFGDRPAQTHMRVPFMSRGRGAQRATAPFALRGLRPVG